MMVFATLIGLLALFSVISFLLDTDEPRRPGLTPEDEVRFWMRFGAR